MKMKVKLDLLFGTLLLAAGTYLSGCTDKGTTPGVPQVSKGEPIHRARSMWTPFSWTGM